MNRPVRMLRHILLSNEVRLCQQLYMGLRLFGAGYVRNVNAGQIWWSICGSSPVNTRSVMKSGRRGRLWVEEGRKKVSIYCCVV